MIYIFLVFLIALTYIYNYYVNDKYIISYIYYEQPLPFKDIYELKNDPMYNPTLKFSFDLTNQDLTTYLSENFILVDMNKGTILERKKLYSYRISELNIGVLYKCLDKDCLLQPEDEIEYEGDLYFNFILVQQKFNLNLQDKTQPLVLGDDGYIKSYIMNRNFFK